MEIPKKIQEAIKNDTLVVFVGAGLSLKFSLPSWKRLAEDVINTSDSTKGYDTLLPVLKNGIMEPIEVLNKIKSEHNNIKKYIADKFKIEEGDFYLHKNILKLSGQIITTNYDNAFEKASDGKIIPAVYTSDFNISEINKSNKPYIFKLHGSYTEPDHCIIFPDDYAKLYTKDSSAREKLKSIFAERTILFIGFSFNDPDINLIFENLDRVFSNNNKHFILTVEQEKFENYKFLEIKLLKDYGEIEIFIDKCLEYKDSIESSLKPVLPILIEKKSIPNVAVLWPNPIDLVLNEGISKISEYFDSLEINLFTGTLNIKTLETLEDYDLIIIASQVYKSKLYVEDDNLKSNLLPPNEICSNIPNDNIPTIFITNEKIDPIGNQPAFNNISTLKKSTIKRFIYKALIEKKLDSVNDNEIIIHSSGLENINFIKGQPKFSSIYNNNRNLEIGKKCLTNVIGRIEEQAAIATRLINNIRNNRLLNIKASGGTGKTVIVKKIAYELYNRGYYRMGVTFRSCESVRTLADFEEILISGFNLTNILNFKEYLIENFSNTKLDLLIILDNFETVVTVLNKVNFNEVLELLKFATDFANIVITSREKLSPSDDFEDVFSLTPLITDDALVLFEKFYGKVENEKEIMILRQDILEELLNNNPLAIKLVTNSRTRSKHINQLKEQLQTHFFESTNEDFTLVFKNNADLNIERTKSIFQSINYSYTTLKEREKIAFELLSLFPDGISLSNFKKCFRKKDNLNGISDSELKVIKDKSLVEDYNGTLQLQPIIRRFADYQFSKRSKAVRQKFCFDAYKFNSHTLKLLNFIVNSQSLSEALKIYNFYKNNLIKVLSYIPDIELSEIKKIEPKKSIFLNYIYSFYSFIVNEKQFNEFHEKLISLQSYFSELPNANTLIQVLLNCKRYYFKDFDEPYKELTKLLSVEEMEDRIFNNEDYIETRYKELISKIHSMEGNTVQMVRSYVLNNDTSKYLNAHFFYMGVINNISRQKKSFHYYEYELMFNRIDVLKLEEYINSLHSEEHLEIMQSTYTLSKIKQVEKKTIQKLVVTNPYTRGLKELMFAFNSDDNNEKIKHFKESLFHLSHIKYYYLEALYYYCIYLKNSNSFEYKVKLEEGINLSNKYYYQYLSYLFSNIDNDKKKDYEFRYDYYPIQGLEDYIIKHNFEWESELKKKDWD